MGAGFNVQLIILAGMLAVVLGLESIFPFFEGRKHRLKHGLPNLVLAGLNGVVTRFVFAGLMLYVISFSKESSFGLLRIWSMPPYLEALVAFVFFDLWMYAWHRMNHQLKLLWRFHRVHHSDTEMDVTTALRFHPGEIVLSSLARLAIIPLLGLDIVHLVAYEMLLQAVILFHHSNIGLAEVWDRVLRAVIVTPNMHRVHHSKEFSETNSNYSSICSVWDRLFQTFRKRNDTTTIQYGLETLRDPKYQTVWGMVRTPFE